MAKRSGYGYTPCACRDCMETAIGEPGKAYCHECDDAGCADYQGVRGMPQECQVERFEDEEDDEDDEDDA